MSASRRRVVATVERAIGDVPSLELVQEILRQRGPTGIEAQALHWSSYFRIHHRQVAALRLDRVFIAGDAAHIHSPFGGQGMNTGLHDVWNLVWKLDLVLHGLGNERLLESYSAERLPLIRQVIATTHLLTRAMATPNRFMQTLRNAVIPLVSRLAPFQHAFVQRLSGLGVAYRGSPVIDGAGQRYFDESLRGGSGIRSRFLLFCDDRADAPLTAAARQLVTSSGGVVELRSGPVEELTLVRPDGYIAYSGPLRDGIAALESVRSVLERQTTLRFAPPATIGSKTSPVSH